jgi:apolipoprotein N-acyltransferase
MPTMSTVEPMAAMKLMHQPATAVNTPRTATFWSLLPYSLASAGLLWASFFPLNQGWCAWFALVPLLFLVRSQATPYRINVAAMAAGYIFYLAALKWMRVAHPMMVGAWLALAFYLALYFPLAVWLLRRIDRLRLPFALTLPVVWVSLEFLRAHFLTGFAWYFLGHTQHDYLAIIQIADLGGVYAVSFLIAAVNGLIFDAIWLAATRSGARGERAPLRVAANAVVVALIVAASLGYGAWRLSQDDFAAGPKVCMFQTNISQDIRNDRRDDGERGESSIEYIIRHELELTNSILRDAQNPDLVVWPETTFADDWYAAKEGTPPNELPPDLAEGIANRRKLIVDIASYTRANVLLGLNTKQWRAGMQRDYFNSALLVDRDGKARERYDKIHRVMFGEYLPAKESLPVMKVFSPYDHEYSLTAGEHQTRFVLPTAQGEYRFGVLICFEDSDAMLSRGYARETADGPPVDFLVNISNDGWFKGTEEHELHLAISRFRAVEARRALVRSVNMGISALVDGNGRVRALPGPSWRESKKMAAAFTAEVPLDKRVSFYAQFGDWLATLCAAGCVGLMGWSLRRKDRANAT